MNASTHILGGIACGLAVADASGTSGLLAAGVTAISAIGSLIPDVDLCTSKAGSKIKPVSFVIGKLFGHRTIFHSPILYIALYALLLRQMPQYRLAWVALIAGIASHLLLDMLNFKGIPLLYPYTKHYHLASIKAGSKGETVLRVLLGVAVLAAIIYLLASGI